MQYLLFKMNHGPGEKWSWFAKNDKPLTGIEWWEYIRMKNIAFDEVEIEDGTDIPAIVKAYEENHGIGAVDVPGVVKIRGVW